MHGIVSAHAEGVSDLWRHRLVDQEPHVTTPYA
jgi:hypothetical protein